MLFVQERYIPYKLVDMVHCQPIWQTMANFLKIFQWLSDKMRRDFLSIWLVLGSIISNMCTSSHYLVWFQIPNQGSKEIEKLQCHLPQILAWFQKPTSIYTYTPVYIGGDSEIVNIPTDDILNEISQRLVHPPGWRVNSLQQHCNVSSHEW